MKIDVDMGSEVWYNNNMGIKLTTEIFNNRSNILYNNSFDYSLVNYIDSQTKVLIICPIHGVFYQKPVNHLRGRGCSKCAGKRGWVKRPNIFIINKLTIEEDPIELDCEIHCRCTYCKKYFIPTKQQLISRISALSGKQRGEYRLYCSNECKKQCPIFRQSKYPKGDKPYRDTSRPDQSHLRQLTLERDDFTCQRCGSTQDLVCHHITGIEINPVESTDVDNCITLCYTCHSRVHSSGQCDTRRQPCKVI